MKVEELEEDVFMNCNFNHSNTSLTHRLCAGALVSLKEINKHDNHVTFIVYLNLKFGLNAD